MKVLLGYLCHYQDRNDYHISLLPTGLSFMAAFLEKKGFPTVLANFSRMGYRKAARTIAGIRPSVLGLSLFTHNRVDTLKLARLVKKNLPRCVIVLGGPHASCLAGELLKRYPEIDYIIRGEGEAAMADLLRHLEKNSPPREKVLEGRITANLDSIPPPSSFGGATIDIDVNEEYKYIITSRGCAHDCSFCCSPSFWKRRVRYRSPAAIMSEIETIYRRHGVIYFSIRDDNFTLMRSRVMEFTQRLRESGIYMMWNCQSRVDSVDLEMLVAMKRAGLEHIQYGVESGSERILKQYNKRVSIDEIRRAAKLTREAGVYLSIYLMAGMRGETAADTAKTRSLIRSILPGDGIVSPVALYPGTALYEREKAEGRIDDSVWFRRPDSGIFMRNDEQAARFVHDLLNELSMIRERSWYRRADFARHRKATGGDCWVTDILEGDYYLDEEDYPSAELCYLRVIKKTPDNPWGYLRMGKLKFRTSDFPGAVEHYAAVTQAAPAYYGGWLKLAESNIAVGDRASARKCLARAHSLNRFDRRIANLMTLVQ